MTSRRTFALNDRVNDDRLDPRHTALLLFDTLNGHLEGAGDGIDPRFRAAVANMRLVLDAARAAGAMIVYAAGSHRADRGMHHPLRTDSDNRLRPHQANATTVPPAVVGGDRSGQVVDALAPQPEDYLVSKFRWSAFAGTYLDLALRNQGVDTIVIVGGSTDVGVASTAFAARDLDYDLVIVSDACTAHESDNHEQLMRRVFPRMARVRDTTSVVGMLGPRS